MHPLGASAANYEGMTVLATSNLSEDHQHFGVNPIDVAFAAGHNNALRDAYDRYSPLVYSICRRSVGEAQASDITQEVFIAAWRNRSRFDISRGGLAPWLTGITRNKIIDHFRSVGREERRVDKVKNAPTFAESSDERLEELTLRMLLVEAIEELPERARGVISMAFFDEMTHVEISARTGIPLGTVKSDIRRSLERLRHGLGYTHG